VTGGSAGIERPGRRPDDGPEVFLTSSAMVRSESPAINGTVPRAFGADGRGFS
jgi:hypothetical protein